MDREAFIAENLRLVHTCCHRMKGRGIEYDDLYGAGCVGLIKAVDGFDPERGLCFSTYAVPVILGEIRRLFRDGGSVKVSRGLKELSLKVTRAQEQFAKQQGRPPTVAELAELLQVSPEEITEALCAAQPTISLTYEDESGEIAELQLSDGNGEEKLFDTLAINSVLELLPEKDRMLIRLRYFAAKTQTETAQRLGMTQVQVSRREKAILNEMRRLLA